VLALMWLYREKIIGVIIGLPSDPEARRFALMVLVAFIPALFVGAFLSDFIKTVLYQSPRIIATAFIVGGIVMLLAEAWAPPATVLVADRTPLGRAFAIGACQALAVIPGVSRSGATMVGGRMLGLGRQATAEFSFFLAMPTISAAFVHDFLEVRRDLAPERGLEIAIGFVTAFFAALVVVKPFLRFVARSGLVPFAWYRIVAGVAIFAAVALGWL
jgi:undecaprenyl-diphosphatase